MGISRRDTRRGINAVRELASFGADEGMPMDRILDGSGLQAGDLINDRMEISSDQELAVVANIVAAVGNRADKGIAAGQRVTFGSTGIYGYALLTSPTLMHAMRLATRYATLSGSFVDYSLIESEDVAQFVCSVDDLPSSMAVFLLARDFVLVGKSARLLLGSDAPLECVDFQFSEEEAAPISAAVTAREYRYDQPRTAIFVARDVADSPMPHSDAHTCDLCVQQCEQQLQRRLHTVSSRVRDLLRENMGASCGDIATQLNLAERTLRRQLVGEGTSYRDIVAQVRGSRAAELLTTTNRGIEEIASELAYADASGFGHAFKRWHGIAPSALRKQGSE